MLGAGTRQRVLLVDDEESVRFSLRHFLSGAGFEVEAAESAAEAQRLAALKEFDVAVVDRVLAGMNGLQVIRDLNSEQPNCQAILISAYPTFESAIRGIHVDLFAYLIKPVDRAEICRVVRQAAAQGRTRREKRLRESLCSSLLGGSPNPIMICDLSGMVIFVNPAFAAVFGYTREELQGRPNPCIPCWDAERSRIELSGLLSGREVPVRETRRVSKNGEEIDVSLSVSLGMDERSRPWSIVTIMNDIRQRMEIQRQLIQIQRMEAVGALAGGLAHDFKNILFVISGAAEMLLHTQSVDISTTGSLQSIQLAAQKGTDLLKQLAILGTGDESFMGPVDVRLLVRKAVDFFRRVAGSGIQVELECSGEPMPVVGNPAQIDQCLFNLLINARDAVVEKIEQQSEKVDDGGCGPPAWIRIEVCNHVHPRKEGGTEGRLQNFVAISVHDSGIGIPAGTGHRVFESFFTTKGAGTGTGLGLATVHRIVKHHGGELMVDSTPGVGSTFRILLPSLTLGGAQGSGSIDPGP